MPSDVQPTPPTQPVAAYIVAATQPGRERFALDNLRHQGFVAYCPMVQRRIRHARRAYDAERPLFPGYAFIAHRPSDRWRALLGTRGLRSIVRLGDGPALLDAAFVDALKAREIDGVVRRPEQAFEVGQQVAVAGGPFDGVIARIVSLEDGDRVVVLLDLLNGAARARVSVTDLRPA